MTMKIPQGALVVVANGGAARVFSNVGDERALSLKQEALLEGMNLDDDGPAGSMPAESTASQLDEATLRVAHFAGWRFEHASHRLISAEGSEDTLSVAESQLLSAFLERPNQVLSREQLLSGRDVSALDRSIDLRVSRLRKRFEQGGHSGKFIKTVYGAGYLLATPVSWS